MCRFRAGTALREPPCAYADFVAGTALYEPLYADFVAVRVQISWQA